MEAFGEGLKTMKKMLLEPKDKGHLLCSDEILAMPSSMVMMKTERVPNGIVDSWRDLKFLVSTGFF